MQAYQRQRIVARRMARVLDVLAAAEAELTVGQVQAAVGEPSAEPVRYALARLVESGRVRTRLAFTPVRVKHFHSTITVYRLATAGEAASVAEARDAEPIRRGGLGERDAAEIVRRVADVRAEKEKEAERNRWDGPHPGQWTPPELRYPVLSTRRPRR